MVHGTWRFIAPPAPLTLCIISRVKSKQGTTRKSSGRRKPGKPGRRRKPEKESQFKYRIRDNLVAAIICAIVLAAGFYTVRSVFFDDSPAVSVADEPIETVPAKDISGADIPAQDQANNNKGAADHATKKASRVSTATKGPGHKFLLLVIDDAGNNLRELEPFLQFPGPITIAVLPGQPHSAESARRVRTAGKELFLHQPMEPISRRNHGPGTIRVDMSHEEIREILTASFNEIGPVAGMNNHEGSRATADPEIMKSVLEICLNEGIHFLDSRTTADTAAPYVARELGMDIIQRDIFLDNKQDRESILAALEAGCRQAEQNGSAVLIGHAWSRQLAAILTEMYPLLISKGFVFVTAGTYLETSL